MAAYPSLASKQLQTGELGNESIIDQASAGLTFLSEEQQEAFEDVTAAYERKFGFPLIIAVRELTAEQMLEQAWRRLDNSPPRSRSPTLLEIAKIANHRLADAVAGTEPMAEVRSSNMAQLH